MSVTHPPTPTPHTHTHTHTHSYEEFIQQTNDLNNMDSYSQLSARAQRVGYNITKVVYRGYEASSSLQATHDEAVQTRTNLKLKTESEEQKQVLQEFKLKREKERTKLSECMCMCCVPTWVWGICGCSVVSDESRQGVYPSVCALEGC